MSDKKIRKVCKKCGSEDVKFDTFAVWNFEKQELEVIMVSDKGDVCEDCDGPCKIVDLSTDIDHTENKSVCIDKTFYDCERGNIWVSEDGSGNHGAYILLRNLPDERMLLLEIAITPANYPGLDVNVIEITAEDLAKHLNNRCMGWFVHKMNLVLEGSVVIEDHYIVSKKGKK